MIFFRSLVRRCRCNRQGRARHSLLLSKVEWSLHPVWQSDKSVRIEVARPTNERETRKSCVELSAPRILAKASMKRQLGKPGINGSAPLCERGIEVQIAYDGMKIRI